MGEGEASRVLLFQKVQGDGTKNVLAMLQGVTKL